MSGEHRIQHPFEGQTELVLPVHAGLPCLCTILLSVQELLCVLPVLRNLSHLTLIYFSIFIKRLFIYLELLFSELACSLMTCSSFIIRLLS